MRSEAEVVITNPTGLHARPAVKLAQLAAGFDADVQIRLGGDGEWVRARSTARVMKLKAGAQSVLQFQAEGAQADAAVTALVDFVRRDFDEGPAATEAPATETTSEDTQENAATLVGERVVAASVASPGLAIGNVHQLDRPTTTDGESKSPRSDGPTLGEAIETAIGQLNGLAEGAGDLARDLVEFQVSLLRDEEFLAPVQSDIESGAPVVEAWTRHLAAEIADYESATSSYMRDRAADLRDLHERVARVIDGTARAGLVPENAVIVVGELTPSRFLELDWNRAVAVATPHGSNASHAAMLARARGVPFLVGLEIEGTELREGKPVIVDAERGCLVVGPAEETLDAYERRVREQRARIREAQRHAAEPARTRAGTHISVMLNVDDPAVLDLVDAGHCDGIGLTRTEFLFHGRSELPDEETQLRYYRRLLQWAGGRPVTIRTLDAGGDKPVPGLTLEGETNPFLGLRGVRVSLARPEVFRVQLRALARAASKGELKVMVPMVTVASELAEVRRLLEDELADLRSAGLEARLPPLGMMVEVPAAALCIESFQADFYSIGSNDLTSYVLAAARDSESTAGLLDPAHPAVLELIARVARHGAEQSLEVSVCGEMAAQPECLKALLEAGVRTLSVPPAALAPVKAALAAL